MNRDEKLGRMLLWFEEQLPEHDIGLWQFSSQPHSTLLVNDETRWISDAVGSRSGFGVAQLVGHGSCTRCGKEFVLGWWGNFGLYPDDEQEQLTQEYPTLTTLAVIEQAKRNIQSDALRDGKCWGGVPWPKPESSVLPCADAV